MLLTVTGAEVRTASSGPVALKVHDGYQPNVVMLDIGLPDTDGYEDARQVRASADGNKLTLVALSGWGQDEDRRGSREAGIDYQLVKPIELEALQKLLASVGSRPAKGAQIVS